MSAKYRHLHRRPDEPGGWWYYRRVLFGAHRDVALGVQDDAKARELRDYYDRLYDAERTDRRLGRPAPAESASLLGKLGIARRAVTYSKPELLETAWRAYWQSRRRALRTADNAWTCLLLILRRAGVDIDRGWTLEDLTGLTIARYETAVLAARTTPLAINRGHNTVASTVSQARMIFSDRARRSAQYATLRLPACIDDFMARPVERGAHVAKGGIPAEAMQRYYRGRALMRRFAPRHWLATLLLREMGLRRGEVAFARWDWIQRVVSQVDPSRSWLQCAIVITDEFGPKGHERRFDLEPEKVVAWESMLELRGKLSPAPEVIPGILAERQAVLDDLCGWLRRIGVATDPKVKPLHLMRALRATELAETRGIEAARAELGHDSQRTTRRHYVLPPAAGAQG